MAWPDAVQLVEVGPRDGLQNEAHKVATLDKIELVHRLQAAGLRKIEVTSYVSPRWVPQMADNAEVMRGITRSSDTQYAVLVPNLKGLEAALTAPWPDEIVVFSAASEAFAQKNIHCSITESLERFVPVVTRARAHGIRVRGAISCSIACPYEGWVAPATVADVARRMKAIGVQEIGVADTLGVGTPRRVQRAMEAVLQVYELDQVSGHFHDTYGQALANVYACLEMGIHIFDTSIAGLGGCPYARGATGNVSTEDVVYLLDGLQIATGVDWNQLMAAGRFISQVLGRAPASRTACAWMARSVCDEPSTQ